MIKALPASCNANVVTIDGVAISSGVIILSEGVGPSTGVAYIDDDKIYYVAKTTPDVSTLLQKISSAITEIISALTVIDAKPVGGTGSAPAPGAASNISTLTSLNAQINTLGANLK